MLGISLLTAILQALSLPMHMWDSIVIYGFKAKILFLEQTFKTDAFMDPRVIHYSADYPLLIPYLEAGFYRWLGHPDDRLIRLLFVAYGAAWMGILYEGLSSRLSASRAALLVTFVATLPLFSNAFMGQAASGFADIPLALYWTAFLVAPRRLLPLLAIGCAFTKSEGLPLVLIGAWARREIGLSLLGLLLLSPWWWVRHHLPHNAAHYLRWMTWSAPLLLEKLRMIVWNVGREFLQVKSWGLFWFLGLGGALWPQRGRPWPSDAKRLLIAAFLQLGIYGYVYLVYPQDLGLLIPITLPRLLIHLVGPVTLAVGWKLAD